MTEPTEAGQRMSHSPNRLTGLVLGTIFLVLGLLGFTVTHGIGVFSSPGGELFGVFEVNPAQSILQAVIGAALLLAAVSHVRAAKSVNTAIGTIFLVLGIVGLFIANTDIDVLALNTPDHVLHFGAAVVLLGVGLGADAAVGKATPAAT